MQLFRDSVLSVVLWVIVTGSVAAGPYRELIVFGDTLSDVDNASLRTLGLQPGPYYFSGRFTNGPVYSELLSLELGLGAMTPSSAGGGNFAFGGADLRYRRCRRICHSRHRRTGKRVLTRGPIDPQTLLVMFAGANDLLGGQTDVGIPVNHLVTDLQRLISAGAQNLLVMNLPPIGLTPRFNGDPIQSATMNSITLQYNATLSSALDELETSQPNLNLFRLDVSAVIDEVVADPSAFGFVNITDPAAPGLEPGASSYDTSLIASNPNGYLFWDQIHPSAAAHTILAKRAFAAVPEPASQLPIAVAMLALAASHRPSKQESDGLPNPS